MMKHKELIKIMEIVEELDERSFLNEEEEFILIENLKLLCEETRDSRYPAWLGGIYYEKRNFELALKYYEIAEAMGNKWVSNGLGYIWYYGRTGKVDYEKAFKYFSKVLELNDNSTYVTSWKHEASFKIADMYKNGYYVEKDYDKYVSIIEGLYQETKDNAFSRPEVFVRLASIRTKQDRIDEAIELYLIAREDLIARVCRNRFFGDLNRINWLVNDLYKLIEFDPTEFDLFDLYYLLKDEHIVSFVFNKRKYEIESKKYEDGMMIHFENKWYKDINDFFQKANLGEETIESQYFDLEDWRIVK